MKKRAKTAPNPFEKGISDHKYLTELARGLEFFGKSLCNPDKSDKDACDGVKEMRRAFRESAKYLKAYADTFGNASLEEVADENGDIHVVVPTDVLKSALKKRRSVKK